VSRVWYNKKWISTRETMLNNRYLKTSNKSHECNYCRLPIPANEIHYVTRGGKVCRYHVFCKVEKLSNAIHNQILSELIFGPRFQHELSFKNATVNEAIRKLQVIGYPIRKIKFSYGRNTRNAKQFILVFLEGDEIEAVKRVLEQIPNRYVPWRDLLLSIFGTRVPEPIRYNFEELMERPELLTKVLKGQIINVDKQTSTEVLV